MGTDFIARRRECEMTGPTQEERTEGIHTLVGSFLPADEAGLMWAKAGGIGTFAHRGFNRGGYEDPTGFDRPGGWKGAREDAPFGILGSGSIGQQGAWRDGTAIPVGEIHAGAMGAGRLKVGGIADDIGRFRGDIYHRKPTFVGRNIMVDTGLDIDPISGQPADGMAVPVGGIGTFTDRGYNRGGYEDPAYNPAFRGSREDAPFGILGSSGIGTYDEPGFNEAGVGDGPMLTPAYRGSRSDAPFGVLGSGNIPGTRMKGAGFTPVYGGMGSYTKPGFRGGYDSFAGWDKPTFQGGYLDAPFGARVGVGEIEEATEQTASDAGASPDFAEGDAATAAAAFYLAKWLDEHGFALGDAWQSRDRTAHGWEVGIDDDESEQTIAEAAKAIAADRNVFYVVAPAEDEHEFVVIFCSDPAACAIVDATKVPAVTEGIDGMSYAEVGAFDWKKPFKSIGEGFKGWRAKMKARKEAKRAQAAQAPTSAPAATSATASPAAVAFTPPSVPAAAIPPGAIPVSRAVREAVLEDQGTFDDAGWDDSYAEMSVSGLDSTGRVVKKKVHKKISSDYILANPKFLLTRSGKKWAKTHPRQVDWFLRHKRAWLRRHPRQAQVLRRHDKWDPTPQQAPAHRGFGGGHRGHGRGRGGRGGDTTVVIEQTEFEPESAFASQYGADYSDGLWDEQNEVGFVDPDDYQEEESAGARCVRHSVSGYNRGRLVDGIGMPGAAPTSTAVGFLDDLGFYGRKRTYGRGSNFQYPGC